MWSSRDVSLVIVLAIVGLLYQIFVGQLGFLFTNIPGANVFFGFGSAIWIGIALLLFEGKRWRFFTMSVLYGLLTMPTFAMGTPYNILPRIPLVITAIQTDFLYCGIFSFFKTRKKMSWLASFVTLEHVLVDLFLRMLMYPFFYSPEYASTFSGIMLLMMPVIIIECLVGGFIGYKIYERIKRFQ